MKTTNFKKLTLGLFAAVALSTSLIACNNKSDNNANDNNVYGYQNCVNCNGIVQGTQFMTVSANAYSNYMQMQLNLSLSGTQATQYNNGLNTIGYNTASSYTGPFAAVGTVNVTSSVSQGYCTLPGGTYTIGTLQAGVWSSGIVMQTIRMNAVGPANLILSLPAQGAQISSTNQRDAYGNLLPNQRLFGNLILESVNGVACNVSLFMN